MKKYLFISLFIIISAAVTAESMDDFIGINEQLGKKIPQNLIFKDEQGIDVSLSKLVDKPTIFMFVYYECPGICSPLMSEVAAEVEHVGLEAGKDYQIISISFDETEGPALAYAKKVNYMGIFKKPIPDNAWKFLTGDSASIAAITKSVGFGFKREGEDFVHPGGLVIVSKDGVITRYLLGTDFMPFDLKMAVLEASEGKVTPTIAKMLKFCYSYDREGKRYALNITRIAGIVTLLAVGVFVLVFIRKPKKQTTEKGSQ